jgi:hypothetical protein
LLPVRGTLLLDSLTTVYRIIRTLHLCTALLALPLLLLYLGSAIALAHRTWIPLSQTVERRSVPLAAGISDAREVAARLMRQGALRGELGGVEVEAGVLRFRVVRPGAASQVVYSAATGTAAIATTRSGIWGFITRLHQLHGAWHEDAALNAWMAALFLLSLSLLAMGGTGLYLWFRNQSERRTGAILLAAGALLTLTLLVSMRTT